jgi:hypothetical protein
MDQFTMQGSDGWERLPQQKPELQDELAQQKAGGREAELEGETTAAEKNKRVRL